MTTSGEVVDTNLPETGRPTRYEHHLGDLGFLHAVLLLKGLLHEIMDGTSVLRTGMCGRLSPGLQGVREKVYPEYLSI
jgi:hypothetical protein